MAYRYELLTVPELTWERDTTVHPPVMFKITNADYTAFKNGTYIPPQGARLVNVSIVERRVSVYLPIERELNLLLEYENIEGHPYR